MNTDPIPDREELARCARRAAFDFSQAEKTLRAWLTAAREMSAPHVRARVNWLMVNCEWCAAGAALSPLASRHSPLTVKRPWRWR